MRDKNRISEAMILIEEIWVAFPDTRLLQLIDTLQISFAQELGVGKDILFFVEDESFIEFLKLFKERHEI